MAFRKYSILRGIALAMGLALAGIWPAWGAASVECWRGWGYRVDPQTRTYISQELLLVTKGPAGWQPGQEVALYQLDRASGRIAEAEPPIVVVPFNPRSYYRNNLNYVDGEGRVAGGNDHLVFGLSHVAPPTADIEKLREYNLWACGLATDANNPK